MYRCSDLVETLGAALRNSLCSGVGLRLKLKHAINVCGMKWTSHEDACTHVPCTMESVIRKVLKRYKHIKLSKTISMWKQRWAFCILNEIFMALPCQQQMPFSRNNNRKKRNYKLKGESHIAPTRFTRWTPNTKNQANEIGEYVDEQLWSNWSVRELRTHNLIANVVSVVQWGRHSLFTFTPYNWL